MMFTGSLSKGNVLIVLIAAIIGFSPVFKADFVSYDDPEHVFNNTFVQKANFSNINHILRGDACVLYIPITIFSYYLDIFLGGKSYIFHLVNVFLHLLNILLLSILLRTLRLPDPLGLITLIFFAVNPVVTESVCWISERKDVLYILFLLASAIFFMKDQQQNLPWYYCASLILFVLSCFSKPMAVSFPLVAAIYLFAHNKLKPNLKKLSPFFLVAAFVSVLTYYFVVIKNGPVAKTNFNDYSSLQKGFLFVCETGFYFIRHWLPVNISLFHFFPHHSELYNSTTLFFFAGGLAFLFCVYRFRHDKRITALLAAWLVMLLPVMHIVANNQSYVNERYFYLTLTLPVYLTGLFLQKLLKPDRLCFLSLGLLFFFVTATFRQALHWGNSETLFKYELSIDNKNSTALNILGYHYNQLGEFDKAKPYLANAVMIDSMNASCLNNYGWSLYGTGHPRSAIPFLKKAILHREFFLEAHNNLGVCYLYCGEKNKALEEFKKAECINRNSPDVMFNLGLFYFQDGQRLKGVSYLKGALSKGHKRAKEFIEMYKLY